jgi:hypothetical protein
MAALRIKLGYRQRLQRENARRLNHPTKEPLFDVPAAVPQAFEKSVVSRILHHLDRSITCKLFVRVRWLKAKLLGGSHIADPRVCNTTCGASGRYLAEHVDRRGPRYLKVIMWHRRTLVWSGRVWKTWRRAPMHDFETLVREFWRVKEWYLRAKNWRHYPHVQVEWPDWSLPPLEKRGSPYSHPFASPKKGLTCVLTGYSLPLHAKCTWHICVSGSSYIYRNTPRA